MRKARSPRVKRYWIERFRLAYSSLSVLRLVDFHCSFPQNVRDATIASSGICLAVNCSRSSSASDATTNPSPLTTSRTSRSSCRRSNQRPSNRAYRPSPRSSKWSGIVREISFFPSLTLHSLLRPIMQTSVGTQPEAASVFAAQDPRVAPEALPTAPDGRDSQD